MMVTRYDVCIGADPRICKGESKNNQNIRQFFPGSPTFVRRRWIKKNIQILIPRYFKIYRVFEKVWRMIIIIQSVFLFTQISSNSTTWHLGFISFFLYWYLLMVRTYCKVGQILHVGFDFVYAVWLYGVHIDALGITPEHHVINPIKCKAW